MSEELLYLNIVHERPIEEFEHILRHANKSNIYQEGASVIYNILNNDYDYHINPLGIQKIKLLVATGIDVNYRHRYRDGSFTGDTLLAKIAKIPNYKLMLLFIERGADQHSKDMALHAICTHDYTEVMGVEKYKEALKTMELLLENGANPNGVDTNLSNVIETNDIEKCKLLIKYGATVTDEIYNNADGILKDYIKKVKSLTNLVTQTSYRNVNSKNPKKPFMSKDIWRRVGGVFEFSKRKKKRSKGSRKRKGSTRKRSRRLSITKKIQG